jgi:hypothetical protein
MEEVSKKTPNVLLDIISASPQAESEKVRYFITSGSLVLRVQTAG